MIPWETLDSVKVEGGVELRLIRRDKEYCIMAGQIPLMNSRMSGSEEALSALPFERLGHRPQAHWLIGGLGMGFTLRAALAGWAGGGILATQPGAENPDFLFGCFPVADV